MSLNSNVVAALLQVSRTAAATEAETPVEPAPLANPVAGEEQFYMYCVPGAVFEAHDGSRWLIEEHTDMNLFYISDVLYPRRKVMVPVDKIRQSIAAWINPVQIRIDPPKA